MFYIPPATVNLSEINVFLGNSDNRATKKWLRKHNIQLVKEGRELVVNKWMIEMAIQSEMIDVLKKNYPTNWFEIYEANPDRPDLTKAILKAHPKVVRVKNQINTVIHKKFI